LLVVLQQWFSLDESERNGVEAVPENATRQSRTCMLDPVAVLGTALGILGLATGLRFGIPCYRQQSAIREVQRAGGKVIVEHGGPEWLRSRLGNKCMTPFDDVLTINLSNSQITDTGMARLSGLTNLRELYLFDTDVTDAGLAYVQRLTNLEAIDLADTKVTDHGLEFLKSLRRLRTVHLNRTPVTDAGVADLRLRLPDVYVEQ
jgi:hypothetical protein